MLVHVLGLLDAFAAGTMVLGHFQVVHAPLLYAALYLFIKLFFFRDWLSFIDAAAAIYCVALFFGVVSGLTWLFFTYFFYKTSVWVFYSFAN